MKIFGRCPKLLSDKVHKKTTYFKCPVGKQTVALKILKLLEDFRSSFPIKSTSIILC